MRDLCATDARADRWHPAWAAVAVAAMLVGCGDGTESTFAAQRIGGLSIPPGFPEPRIPDGNVPTVNKVELGRRLFYDVRLSANRTQSCASCHEQSRAFTDGRSVAVGSTGELHPRNSSNLTNAAYNATLTWANPVLVKLEDQINIPIFGEAPIELGVTGSEDEVLARLSSDPDYSARFSEVFGGATPVTWPRVVDALASFCRSMISGRSPFDRYTYDNETSALTASQIRGLNLFFSERLECFHCHGGFNFSASTVHDGQVEDAARFHNTGLYNVDGEGGYPADNLGLYEITGQPGDIGKFRAPTLRNVEVTAPYFHDGSAETLEEVIRIYEAGGRVITTGPNAGDGRANPLKSGFIVGFTLNDRERDDLIAFLNSLTDEVFLTDPSLSDPFAR